MDIETIALSFTITASLALLYGLIVSLEIRYGKRIATGFRGYLDRQVLSVVRKINNAGERVGILIKKGGGAVEDDIVHPITDSVSKVGQRYQTLKTGSMQIKKTPLSKISPYLRQLFTKKRR